MVEFLKRFEIIKVELSVIVHQNTNWHERSNCQADCKKNSNILIARLEPFQVLATKHRNGENEEKLWSKEMNATEEDKRVCELISFKNLPSKTKNPNFSV